MNGNISGIKIMIFSGDWSILCSNLQHRLLIVAHFDMTFVKQVWSYETHILFGRENVRHWFMEIFFSNHK